MKIIDKLSSENPRLLGRIYMILCSLSSSMLFLFSKLTDGCIKRCKYYRKNILQSFNKYINMSLFYQK